MILRILFFCVIGVSALSAQPIVRECFDKKGIVDEANSEYCVVGKKVLRLDEKGSGRYDTVKSYVDTVRAFYTSTNKLKFLRIYNQDAYREGNFEEYYPNGNIKESGSFKKGHKSGLVIYYDPSGKKQSILEYSPPDQKFTDYGETDFKIIDYWDSAGKQIVAKGNGKCHCKLISGRNEIGNVVDGLRDSVWSEYLGDTLILTEQYSLGKFIQSVRYDEGTTFKYTAFEQMAEFPGGMQELVETFKKNLRYPKIARKQRIQGAVFTSFVVDKDGTIYDVKVVKGISEECDQEAMRVIALLTPWHPGRQRGRAVKSRFVLPIRFNL